MNTKAVGKLFNTNLFKKAVTQLGKPGALLPVALLEVTVDTGRSCNAYNRGGVTELRERATDDISAGIFWLFGAVWLNKLGNWIGKKFLGIKNPEYSLGRDKARFGMEQALSANPGISKKKLAAFKLAKVISSIGIAIAFIGWVLPKINQTITKKISDKNKGIKTVSNQNAINNAKILFKDFEEYRKNKNKSNPSFGISADTIGRIAHNLEHNATWRLGSTDGGILVGRTTNAWKRSHDEAIEYGFRDAASSYFYLWATGHIQSLFNKMDTYKGKNTRLDPISAARVNNHLAEILNGGKMSTEQFKTAVFGQFDREKFNLIKDAIGDKGNITVEDFIRLTGADSQLRKKARFMSKFQPNVNGKAILTDVQAADVLTTGKITDPKFLFGTINRYYTNLAKKLGFTSVKDIERTRNNIFDYAQSVIEMAEKQAAKTGKPAEVTLDLLKKASKRNTVLHSTYLGVGLGVSILFLSTLIPKMQYWITKKRTGKDGFPGAQ